MELPQDAGKMQAMGAGRDGLRFLSGWAANVVFTTFITHEYSGGPWTSAVQGPKKVKMFKIFISSSTKDAYE
jgi:hypothetical protein